MTKLVRAGEEYPNYSSLSFVKTTGGPIYSFKDFWFGQTGEEVHLSGKWFLIPKGYHYHHFIKEMVGPFLYYKNNIDDSVNILWVEQPINSPTGQKLELVNLEFKELLSKFSMKTIDISTFSTIKLTIDELVSFSCVPRFLYLNQDFIKHYEFCNIGYFHFPEVNQELRKFFSPFMVEDLARPKKIFVTRGDVVLNEADKDWEHFKRSKNNNLTRSLEDFFKSKGFEILSLSGMSVFEQISFFYNAEIVAGVPGTNLCNLIYSKPDVSVIQIKNASNYSYPWEKEFESVISPKYKYIEVPETESYENYLQLLEDAWKSL